MYFMSIVIEARQVRFVGVDCLTGTHNLLEKSEFGNVGHKSTNPLDSIL